MASRLRDRRGSSGVGGAGRLYQRLGRLETENVALREQVDRLQRANQQLQARVHKLTGQVEELRRAAKRQAAPFSKNTPVARLLGQLGLKVTPGGVVQALHRAGRRATPTWKALVAGSGPARWWRR